MWNMGALPHGQYQRIYARMVVRDMHVAICGVLSLANQESMGRLDDHRANVQKNQKGDRE